jgi:hypothetical protein
MASYTIPEQVIGVPLFVPDGYDQFSVVTGGMPNGDDCLRVRGDLGTYKAFQKAGSEDIFDNPANTSLVGAMSFWIKSPAGPTAGTSNNNNGNFVIITCESQASPVANTNVGEYAWQVFAFSTAQVGGRRSSSTGTNQFTANLGTTPTRNDAWHLIVMNWGISAPKLEMYSDLDLTTGQTGARVTGAITATTPLYLCIGGYGLGMGLGATGGQWAQDFQLGKLAFHDHALNDTERALLYYAMVGT